MVSQGGSATPPASTRPGSPSSSHIDVELTVWRRKAYPEFSGIFLPVSKTPNRFAALREKHEPCAIVRGMLIETFRFRRQFPPSRSRPWAAADGCSERWHNAIRAGCFLFSTNRIHDGACPVADPK